MVRSLATRAGPGWEAQVGALGPGSEASAAKW